MDNDAGRLRRTMEGWGTALVGGGLFGCAGFIFSSFMGSGPRLLALYGVILGAFTLSAGALLLRESGKRGEEQ